MSKSTMAANGYTLSISQEGKGQRETPSDAVAGLAKPRTRQNKTEMEFGRILEAQKNRGEILDYRPFGFRLEWGANPQTGKPMVYSPDFTVYVDAWEHPGRKSVEIRLIETKGGHIWPKDLIRFRGCRAEWPQFEFQLWQKKSGEWKQLE